MPKTTYAITEVWIRTVPVTAENEEEALANHEVAPVPGLNLCNWHVTGLANASDPEYRLTPDKRSSGVAAAFISAFQQ